MIPVQEARDTDRFILQVQFNVFDFASSRFADY